jgi:hypothetical protein
MAGLPKSIIKKYGVSKKAWRVFRAQKSKRRAPKRKASVVRRTKKVARRRRTVKKRARRAHSRMKSGLVYDMAGGMAYGFGRDFVSSKLAPVTAKIPGGVYADNIMMGAVSWALAKGKIPFANKLPLMRKIGRAGLIIESAMLGEDIRRGTNFGSGSTGSSQLSF